KINNSYLIVIGTGCRHTSLIPNLLVEGVCEAICHSDAKKVFVVNLMNRKGQTTGFQTSHYMQELIRFLGKDIFDHILVNVQKPTDELIEFYAAEGELVENDLKDERLIFAEYLGKLGVESIRVLINSNLLRHDLN